MSVPGRDLFGTPSGREYRFRRRGFRDAVLFETDLEKPGRNAVDVADVSDPLILPLRFPIGDAEAKVRVKAVVTEGTGYEVYELLLGIGLFWRLAWR
jgi:hypothetical protein